jgi:beta-glucosidase
MPKKWVLYLTLTIALCIGLLPVMSLAALADDPTPTPIPIYMDPSYSYAERAADLVGRMTSSQKGNEMYSQSAPAITAASLGGGALNVPATVGINTYTWWQEALHGYSLGNCTNSNSYPQNTSIGNTWDPDLYYIEAGYIGDEIRERASTISSGSNAGNAVNLTLYSPTVNLHRDPRWGRNEESYSEDPFFQGVMGSAFVQGMQGMDPNGNLLYPNGLRKVNPTTKHYVANNSEVNRLDGGAVTSLRALREYYSAPYRNIIKQADVSSVMEAYSTLNGDPCSWSSYLIETLLRQTFGFSGYMTGDCDAVSTIKRHNFVNPYTGSVLTTVEQLSQAMAHGMDLECNGGYNSSTGTYGSNMTNMLAQAVTTDKGKFTENQVDVSLHRLMTARMQTGEWDSNNPYTAAAAARKAKQTGSIGWQTPERLGMIDAVNAEAVVMLKNAVPAGETSKILPLAVPASGAYKVVIVGAWQTNAYLGLYSSGQSDSTNRINIQQRIVSDISAINPGATFTYLTGYGSSTSSYTISTADQATIAAADAVIVVTGTDGNYSKEDGDRASTVLQYNQDLLISNVGKLNPKTIAVMETCGPMQVTQFENDVAAILWSSFLGNRKVGFGDVITGKVNPSGKLTDTWYQNVSNTGVSDIPGILDYDLFPSEGKQGRTYMYFTGTPSYPFGYGLSYTTFGYSNLTIQNGASTAAEFNANDTVTVSFDVTNTGAVKGKEIAELYVAQPNAPAALKRPIKRLEGFKKIELEPGETKTVTLNVKVPDLAFYDEATDRYIVDTGAYEIQVGGNSANVPLKGSINVSGALNIVPKVLTAKPSQTGDQAQGIEERLIFKTNKIVDPKLTVAMNDESLYGYIIKQQSSLVKQKSSTPFPDGMTFSYTSNRPSVVSVTDGVIRTVTPGVATITATATYNGVSASTDFVVYVIADTSLSSLEVNGVPVSGFSPTTYSYTVPVLSNALPKVTATASDFNATVTIVQAAAVPGTATVTVTNGTDQLVYTINFTVDTSLSDLQVNGVPVSGFSPTVYTYNMATPVGPIPQVTKATATDPGATVEITQATGLPGQAIVTVSIGSAYSTYAINFTVNTSLSDLQVNGVPVSGFSPTVYTYNILTPVGPIPQVTKATANDPGAVVTIAQAMELPGAATVTVTIGGTQSVYTVNFTVNTSLSGLKINGKQPAAFSPTGYTYNMQLPEGLTAVPQVAATAADPGAKVTIAQATTLPGQALVTVSIGSAQSVYKINFSYNVNGSDEFDSSILGSQWHWVREEPSTWSLTSRSGFMMVSPRQGDIYGTGTGTAKNILLQNASGDWTIETKLVCSIRPHATYQQGGLIVYQDDDNYLKMEWEATGSSSSIIQVLKESGGTTTAVSSSNGNVISSSSNTVWFRIAKSGNSYTAYYSTDGTNFTAAGTTTLSLSNIQVGFVTINGGSGTNTDLNIYYDYFHTTSLIPAEIVNRLPALVLLPNYTMDEGKQIAFKLSGSDPDSSDSLTYFGIGLPAGASLDPATGKFNWVPGYSQAGVYPVQFGVTDGFANATAATTIVVNNVDQAPVMAAISNCSVDAGQPVSFTVSASDPDGDTLTYSTGILPSGASFDAGNHAFSWTPEVPGTYTVQFTVNDGRLNDSKTVTITVNTATGDQAPVMSAIPTYVVKTGKLVSFTVKASDPDNDPLTYSAGTLPAGAIFNAGTKKFSWTPTIAGTYTVQFTVDDGSLSDSKTATIIVQ